VSEAEGGGIPGLKGNRPMEMSCRAEAPKRYVVAEAVHMVTQSRWKSAATSTVQAMKLSDTRHEMGGVVL
jgi:hypothetical protein